MVFNPLEMFANARADFVNRQLQYLTPLMKQSITSFISLLSPREFQIRNGNERDREKSYRNALAALQDRFPGLRGANERYLVGAVQQIAYQMTLANPWNYPARHVGALIGRVFQFENQLNQLCPWWSRASNSRFPLGMPKYPGITPPTFPSLPQRGAQNGGGRASPSDNQGRQETLPSSDNASEASAPRPVSEQPAQDSPPAGGGTENQSEEKTRNFSPQPTTLSLLGASPKTSAAVWRILKDIYLNGNKPEADTPQRKQEIAQRLVERFKTDVKTNLLLRHLLIRRSQLNPPPEPSDLEYLHALARYAKEKGYDRSSDDEKKRTWNDLFDGIGRHLPLNAWDFRCVQPT